jgi:hypothetical protein
MITWQLTALVACLSLCAAIETTRRARLDSSDTLLYRGIIGGFFLLPAAPLMVWPTSLAFYLMVAGASLLAAYTSLLISDLAAKRNGRVAMMVQPLAILLTFVGWLATSPQARDQIAAHSYNLYATLICLAVIGISLQFMRRNDYAWWALRAVLPVAIAQAVLFVAYKGFLADSGALLPLILTIVMLQNFGMVILTPLMSLIRRRDPNQSIYRFARFPLLPLILISALHSLSTFALILSISLAGNPAYPLALMALAPLVFYVYYWVRGWPDRASPWAGLCLALAATLLGVLHA